MSFISSAPTYWRRRAKRRPLAKLFQSNRHFCQTLESRLLLSTIDVSVDIPNGTIWTAGNVERITGNAHVPAGSTLTIQPGAVIKFNAFAGLSLQVDGTVLASGAAGQPIIFTSIEDDTAAGDTGGNGASSAN